MENNNAITAERIKVLREPQNYIIPILKMLQENGGELNYSQIDKLMPLYADITEDEMNFYKMTNKGNKYTPYWIGRNFAVKQLSLVRYVTHDRGLPVKLTVEGLNLNVDEIDIERDINAIIKPYVDMKNKERKAKKASNVTIEDDEEEQEEAEIEELNNETDQGWCSEILKNINSLDPYKFEQFSRGLLMVMGFEIDPKKGISRSGDGGIDGFGYCLDKQSLRTMRVAIQCKRFKDNRPVGSPDINSLRGAIDTNRADYGIFITTSYYSDAAIKSSKEGATPITLIKGDDLVELMIKYKYKVKEVTTYTPDQDYFMEAKEELI